MNSNFLFTLNRLLFSIFCIFSFGLTGSLANLFADEFSSSRFDISLIQRFLVAGDKQRIRQSQKRVPASPENIRLSPSYQKLYDDFLELVNVSSRDEVTRHLIERVYEKGGPIKIALTLKSKSNASPLAFGRGTNIQYQWFDSSDESIYFSGSKAIAADCNYERTAIQQFRHELMRSLFYRNLKETYPSSARWASFYQKRVSAYEFWIPSFESLLPKGDVTPSFIEGVANAIERMPLSRETSENTMCLPYSVVPSEIGSGLINHLRPKNNQFCFTSWWPYYHITLHAPYETEGEIYLSRALNILFEKFDFLLPENLTVDSDPLLIVSAHNERMKTMIDAIAFHSPTHIEELARDYDRISQSDLAYRWLREFFDVDYKSGGKALSNPPYAEGPYKNFFREEYCIDSTENDLFLSPLIYSEKDENTRLSQNALVEKLKPSDLEMSAQESIRENDQELEAAQTRLLTFEDVTKAAPLIEKYFKVCELDAQVNAAEFSNFSNFHSFVYFETRKISPYGIRWLDDSGLTTFLLSYCPKSQRGRTITTRETYERLKDEIRAVKPSEAQNIDDYRMRWLKLRELRRTLRNVRLDLVDQLIVTKTLLGFIKE